MNQHKLNNNLIKLEWEWRMKQYFITWPGLTGNEYRLLLDLSYQPKKALRTTVHFLIPH
jgi:hypothetical protein